VLRLCCAFCEPQHHPGVRASPHVHWKCARTPLLDEAIHHKCESGCGYTKLLPDTEVSKNHGASWGHTFAVTVWLVTLISPCVNLYMIPHCIMLSICSLGVGTEKHLTQKIWMWKHDLQAISQWATEDALRLCCAFCQAQHPGVKLCCAFCEAWHPPRC
jgi:hypothetical protein